MRVVGNFVAGGLQGYGGSALNALMTPLTRHVTYTSNYFIPNAIPDSATVVDAACRGVLRPEVFAGVLHLNGVNISTQQKTGEIAVASEAWRGIIESNYTTLDTMQVAFLYTRGLINQDAATKLFKRSKTHPEHANFFNSLVTGRLTPDVTTSLYWRGHIEKSDYPEQLKRFTGYKDKDIELFREASKFIPPPTDLMRFVVRDAFNDEFAAENEYDKTYPGHEFFLSACQAQGIGLVDIMPPGQRAVTLDVPKLYWRSHWQLPSPTQLYEMIHRLRPNRLDRFAFAGGGLEAVDSAKVRRMLEAQDYAPKWVAPLTAISYRNPTRIDIRRMFFADAIDEAELYEQLLDIGYLPADASALTRFFVQEKVDKDEQKRKKEIRKKYGKLLSAIISAYKQGAYSPEDAVILLNGILDDEEEASAIVQAIDLDRTAKLASSLVRSVKSSFFTGYLLATEARDLLVSAGLNTGYVTDLVSGWERLFSLPRRNIAASKIVSLAGKGVINKFEAYERLAKLGYADPDLLLHALEIDHEILKRVEREKLAAARTEAGKQKAINASMKKQKDEEEEARQDLMKQSSPAMMKKWYKLGLIDEETIRFRLDFFGWEPDNINRYMGEINDGEAPAQ